MIRYRLFEIWRLVAALLIMLYHFGHFAPGESQWVKDDLSLLRPLLDMFFIISGFLIFSRYGTEVRNARSYVVYLGKRLARLYPLHLATLSYFVLVGLAIHFGFLRTGGEAGLYQWDTLVANLLLIQAWGVQDTLTFNFVSWSLSAEWFAYIFLPLIILAYRFGGRIGLFLLLALSYVVLEAMVHTGIMPFESWVLADTWGAYRTFADFVLGAFLAVLVAGSPLTLASRGPAWIAIIAACVSMALQLNIYLTLALLGIAVFLAGVAERNDPERYTYPAFLRPAAAVSFGIYLWHPVTESLFFSFVWSHFIGSPSSLVFFAYTAAIMLLTVGVAVASYQIFEARLAGAFLRLTGLRRPERGSGAATA
ncbi:acyltransferase family protein [Nitratireductor pacificus]|uniref:Acyltransferase family protein n=1 Tax=Nitratireductor pacificus pht-3B TaxID=391937 RepID=K2N4Y8_9HYPH|nr:acyltransferase [Nitratireductor pacificus]EKF19263.1 acyltransferase family protein [Nitratireductor pacificus pht-3B]